MGFKKNQMKMTNRREVNRRTPRQQMTKTPETTLRARRRDLRDALPRAGVFLEG